MSLLSIEASASSILLASFDFLNTELNLLMFVLAKDSILSITKDLISRSDLAVKFGSYLTLVVTSTYKNSGSTTLGTVANGDLSLKKSSISLFLLSGIPSAFFKSTEIITLPNSGGSTSSPPYTFNVSISLKF